MDVLFWNIHHVQQFSEKPAVTSLRPVGHRIILVDREDFDILEGDLPFLITAGKPLVKRNWRSACGKAQLELAAKIRRLEIFYGFNDDVSDAIRRICGIGEDLCVDLLISMEDVAGKVLLDKSPVFG